MQPIKESELIINPDGSIYHLNLLPEDIAQTIITVGDPDRVDQVAKYLDSIELTKQKREFKTVTGYLGQKRLTIISTGIGTDNIDIVFNELDALANIDFNTRLIKEEKKKLNIIRIGTSGIIKPTIPVDSFLISTYAIGMEGLLSHYAFSSDEALYKLDHDGSEEYFVCRASNDLIKGFQSDLFIQGITLTAAGFYGPQNRSLRLKPRVDQSIHFLRSLEINGLEVTNLEMETAGIYGLGYLLGHNCISLNALLANRALGTFSATPVETVERLIQQSLHIIESLEI